MHAVFSKVWEINRFQKPKVTFMVSGHLTTLVWVQSQETDDFHIVSNVTIYLSGIISKTLIYQSLIKEITWIQTHPILE